MSVNELTEDAVLRIGEVSEVDGRKIVIKVDRNKNLTDIFLNGNIIRNISVNSFIEIRKGFLTIIGKVDGERIQEIPFRYERNSYEQTNKSERYLTVSLSGYIERSGKFVGGTKELPLIGNEAYIITRKRTLQIYDLADDDASVSIGTTEDSDIPIPFPIDGLFNSHIAIFGNTGSGKSNTLASLYKALCEYLSERNPNEFSKKTRFLLFDFNGEYTGEKCILASKKIFNLTTRNSDGSKLPIDESSLLDVEMLAILCSATDKTQKPFLKRSVDLYKHVFKKDAQDSTEHFRNILRQEIKHALKMSDKVKTFQILDYLRDILPALIENDEEIDIDDGIEWNNTYSGFTLKSQPSNSLSTKPELIESTKLYSHVGNFNFDDNFVSKIIKFMNIQLIKDIRTNRALNEHIAPAISKLKSKQKDVDKIFDTGAATGKFWESNFVVVNLSDVNLDMKKTIPLLVSKKAYSDHKQENNKKSLTIIIDEAHNILSTESFREAESWKDYRLETFEEIIKEGRKFGVFVTISSQRPNDISATITSQAHNYFIHRLVNQKDLLTISNAVSYIDRITEESIPTLPTGTCIFSGVASQMPLKVTVKALSEHHQPKSHTLKFGTLLSNGKTQPKKFAR